MRFILLLIALTIVAVVLGVAFNLTLGITGIAAGLSGLVLGPCAALLAIYLDERLPR